MYHLTKVEDVHLLEIQPTRLLTGPARLTSTPRGSDSTSSFSTDITTRTMVHNDDETLMNGLSRETAIPVATLSSSDETSPDRSPANEKRLNTRLNKSKTSLLSDSTSSSTAVPPTVVAPDIDSTPKCPPPEASNSSHKKPAERAPDARQTTPESTTGWDDHTGTTGAVLNFGTDTAERRRRVACTAKMMRFGTISHGWSFGKVFGDEDFIAAGQLLIHPNCSKSPKSVRDNTYMFYVIKGAVEVKIHTGTFILATGGMFMVPRGNNYSVKNISNHDAQLFFAQGRKIVMSKDEESTRDALIPSFFDSPTSKASILLEWLLQRLVAYYYNFRQRAPALYAKLLLRYGHYLTTRRLHLICFILGLMVRRLPFLGTPPIINVQFVQTR